MKAIEKQQTQKQRDYLFDNYKVLLILLVVMGHFIEPCADNTEFLHTLKWLIVSFHMPAFIFISGYFSKRELPLSVIIRKLAVPYIAYEFIYYFFYTFITHKETGLYLLYPKFSLWYLLALFVWRAVTPYVKKAPYYMLIAVAAGLLIGCSDMADNFLSLPRILYFYPFFLAGMNFNRDTITKLRHKSMRILAASQIILFTIFLALSPICDTLSPKVFYGRYNYESLGQGMIEGILSRSICYVIGFAMTFAVMILVSEKKRIYSYIGTRTMAIYLFHGLTYSFFKDCTSLLKNVDTTAETVLLLASCVTLTIAFSIPQLTAFTNQIANLHLPQLTAARKWTLQRLALIKMTLLSWKPDYRSFRILMYGGRV